MAAINSRAFLPSKPVPSKPVPAVIRGDLVHIVGPAAFAEFRRAVCAWSAAEADRVEALELLKQAGAR